MSQRKGSVTGSPEPNDLSAIMAGVAEESQSLISDWIERHAAQDRSPRVGPWDVARAFYEMTTRLMSDPVKIVQAQMNLWTDYMKLWQSTTRRMLGDASESPLHSSGVFHVAADREWTEGQLFDYVKQSYLLGTKWLQSTMSSVDAMDAKMRRKLDFYTREYVDAMAASDFIKATPELLEATVASAGDNLLRGLRNQLAGLDYGDRLLGSRTESEERSPTGTPRPAATPGQVVFQNEVMQLIQYDATTRSVFQHPLLIVPSWCDKYYVLDLAEQRSFVRWAVAQGFTVFMISWVDPRDAASDKSFEDYVLEGPIAALEAIEQATGESRVGVVGHCLGGTLLSCALAYLAARREPRVASASLFASLVDFSEPGELRVFIDEEYLAALQPRTSRRPDTDGLAAALTIEMLRANDLVWSHVVGNYVLGDDPLPYDLLLWNADRAQVPARMHTQFLRDLYQDNLLKTPGALSVDDTPLELRKITAPCFVLSAREDHIAPWRSCYATAGHVSAPVTFVQAAFGHVAAVINPVAEAKHGFRTNPNLLENPADWLSGARYQPGSWWPTWAAWARRHAGPQVPPRSPGEGKLASLEEAPGSYLKIRGSG